MNTCIQCGTEFVPSKFNKAKQFLCSIKCRRKYHRIKFRKQRYLWYNSWARKKARENWHTRICKNKDCNKEFLPSLKHKNQQTYCSINCRYKWNRKWINKTEYAKAKKRFEVSERKIKSRANGGKFTKEEWELMKKEYHFSCNCCGRKEPAIVLTKDHIIPISKNGRHEASNIQPLCLECNVKKRNTEWTMFRAGYTVHVKPPLKI